MKRKLSAVLPIVALLACSGCKSTNVTELVGALAKDPATAHIKVTSEAFGTLEWSRTNPGTNTLPHTVNADGSIRVGADK